MSGELIKKMIRLLVVFFVMMFLIYLVISNKGTTNKTEEGESLGYPSEHFYLQRSYPDMLPDLNAIQAAMNIATTDAAAARRSSATGFNASWQTEGPGNIGGRINAVTVHPTDPNIIYVGNAAGGIFKTTNGGTNWFPIFDDKAYLGIACIVLDPIDPNIVYVGTGDPNISGFPVIGDGIYKSVNGGVTWTHVGLTPQRIVSRIVIDPTNTSVIYAATMGLPFVRNTDRGLYKSVDGGSTWNQILFISDDAGVIDLVMDPSNPNVLYAAGWNRIRNNQESVTTGQAAKVYKTTDGGASWNILSNGLPQTDQSRVGLCISNSNPNVLYAIVVGTDYQHQGIYKTTNGGVLWNAVSATGLPSDFLGGFGWYFAQIRVNPTNPNDIMVLGVDMYRSTNSGADFSISVPPWWSYDVHADKHDFVYAANNTWYVATDGGLYKSVDLGNNWTDIENIPNTQFYRVVNNPHVPGTYTGGAQDNGTTTGNAASFNSWPRLLGGDGFQARHHPTDPMILTGETQNGSLFISYDDGQNWSGFTNGIDNNDRRNWDMPYIQSTHNPDNYYTGTYRPYKYSSGSWTDIGPDITDGIIFGDRYHTVSTLAESPMQNGKLYYGTTDGNVWYSPNDGAAWIDRTTGLPDRYVTSLKSSVQTANRVFVSHSGYKSNDFIPHVHRSDNDGQTWVDISGNLPQIAVNSLFIYPNSDDIIFAGTDGGVYATLNGGGSWQRLGNNMPVIPVYDLDLDVANNRLIAGTHARSIMTYPIDSLLILTSGNYIQQALRLTIYPNPARDRIYISLPFAADSNGKINIYSSSGQLLQTQQTKNGVNQEINISNLDTGIYLTSIENQGRKFASKFVVR